MSSRIHPTAIIHDGAELGNEVDIGAYSIIGPHVKLGDGCQIGPHVVIEGYTTLGRETSVSQFASVGSAPQDLKFHGEPSTLVIGERNKIREYVTLQPGTESGTMATIIGDENLFMANSHVAHDCRVGNNNVLANSCALAGHVQTGNGVILGGLVGIHQFVRIGDLVMISAGSMVGSDIPPFCNGQGDRCFLRGINLIGLRRAGFGQEDIAEVRRTYRHFFSSVGSYGEKLKELPTDLAARPAVKMMVDFIKASVANEKGRGICHPAKEMAVE